MTAGGVEARFTLAGCGSAVRHKASGAVRRGMASGCTRHEVACGILTGMLKGCVKARLHGVEERSPVESAWMQARRGETGWKAKPRYGVRLRCDVELGSCGLE